MALCLSNSPLDVPPPLNPTPEITPSPAATNPGSSPRTSVATPSLSSLEPSSPRTCGRSKQECWGDSSPTSSEDNGPPPSYLEVLLSNTGRASPSDGAVGSGTFSASGAAAGSATGASAGSAAAGRPPLGQIPAPACKVGCASPRSAAGRVRFVRQRRASRLDPEGWQRFRSGREHLDWRRSTRPRRRVPADLVGKCFNCFSATHTAARCHLQVRCFRCRSLGHRSYECPGIVRGGRTSQPERRSVWRRISPAQEPAITAPPQRSIPAGSVCGAAAPATCPGGMMDSSSVAPHADGADGRAGRQRRRRHPRHRRREDSGRSDSSPAAAPAPDVALALTTMQDQAPEMPPPCIISWSDQVAYAEEDLARAVVVTVIGSTPLAPANAVAAAIATRLEVEAASLVLRRASSSTYLLFLPNAESVDRLVSLRQPLHSLEFSLLCKRWSRLAGAIGRTLPCLVDIELRGIPAHVWETSIVEQFLSPHAWIDHVHLDTLDLVDLSTFRCSAWCSDLSSIPRSKELWVTEPPSAVVEDPQVKRILVYPIDVHASVVILPDAPPSNGDNGGDDSREDGSSRQRCRFSAPLPPPLLLVRRMAGRLAAALWGARLPRKVEAPHSRLLRLRSFPRSCVQQPRRP
ncbi:uncharacterized protein [Miscanthus floridulus]|uniref:uncharacterized protein n=1 Tax=Miscanthus floridulus TaxID=154761 RepID=UPI003458DF60